MNILLVYHHHLDRGAGAAGATCQLAEEYERLGHSARIYSFDDLPRGLSEKQKTLLFPAFVLAHLARSARRRLDVVDASSESAVLWAWARRGRRPLLVVRSHGLEHVMHLELLEDVRRGEARLSWKYPLFRGSVQLAAVAEAFRRADLALFLNRFDLDYAVRELRVRPERARLTRNGIPDSFLALPFHATPMLAEQPLGIAQVGSYIHRKGISYAAPALANVLARHPRVRLTFLGTGHPREPVLADYPAQVHGQIDVLPRFRRDELPDLLATHHVKLFPSLSEGFALALVEAMACGLAPVAAAIPGPLEILRDGENSLLVPARDSAALEAALERLVGDRYLLDRLRRAAQLCARSYAWSDVARETIELYGEFAARAGAA